MNKVTYLSLVQKILNSKILCMMFFFCSIIINSQNVTLTRVYGTNSLVCSGARHSIEETYFVNYTGGGTNPLCQGSNIRLAFKVSGGVFATNSSTTYSMVDGYQSGHIGVIWDNPFSCSTIGNLTVTAYGVDPNNFNNVSACATRTLAQRVSGEWDEIVSGNSYIQSFGTYSYSVNPACGATAYNWNVPISWQILSQNNNQITVSIQQGDQPGTISCTPVTTNWICPQTAELNVGFSNCLGKPLGEYDPQKIENKIAAGDFDNDGKEDDLVAFYDYLNSNTKMHVWLSDGTKFDYQGDNGWWQGNSFDANRVIDVVTGDFDNDGYRDDVAATYDWFNTFRIYIWTSNGSSFTALNQWVSTSSFTPALTEHKVVSGDFDHDNYIDDIMIFYKNTTTFCNMYLWMSNGSGFASPSIAMTNFNHDGSNFTGRIVSGDFDNDGWIDDVAGFYKNSTFSTSLYVWTCPGSCTRSTWWSSQSYSADRFTGNVVSGDFDNDGKHDDIAVFYYYGNWETRAHMFIGNNGNFAFQGNNGWWLSTSYDDQNNNRIKYRVVSGEFAHNNNVYKGRKYDDITALYDYPCYSANLHLWKSTNSSLAYQGDGGWWGVCDLCNTNRFASIEQQTSKESENSLLDVSKKELNVKITPNPSNGTYFIESETEISNVTIEVYNLTGELITSKHYGQLNKLAIDITNQSNGIYFIYVSNPENYVKRLKLIKQ